MLSVWLVRYKLRRLGYRDIYRVMPLPDGFAALAHDQWGRNVKLFVDARTGVPVSRAGYGLELPRHLAALGYADAAIIADREGQYSVRAFEANGTMRTLKIDPMSGAVWFELA